MTNKDVRSKLSQKGKYFIIIGPCIVYIIINLDKTGHDKNIINSNNKLLSTLLRTSMARRWKRIAFRIRKKVTLSHIVKMTVKI